MVAVTSRVVPSAPVPREAAAESSLEPEPEPELEPETETEPEHEISPLVEIDQPPKPGLLPTELQPEMAA